MRPPAGPAQAPVSEERLSAIPDICRPKALGPVPRLGLGSRTTVLGWPVIFRFLTEAGVYANAIQNSVARELMPLEMLGDASTRPTTFLPGLGPVPVGHTGSTIEGLPEWGSLAAAEAGYSGPGFGADADHLPVHDPDSDNWAHTLKLIRCSRGYTHFTLDVGTLVDWTLGPTARLARVPDAIALAIESIRQIREGVAFDLEISLDESPEAVSPSAAATTAREVDWLLRELSARGIGVDYVAPHLGFTKGCDATDYTRLADNAGELCATAGKHLALISIHSGDYLSSTTRQVLGKACGGKLLFKVSPALQDILLEAVLSEENAVSRQLRSWTLDYAARCGYTGSSQADAVHKYAFAAFGVRDDAGDFTMRELLYDATASAKQAFTDNLARYLRDLRDDLSI